MSAADPAKPPRGSALEWRWLHVEVVGSVHQDIRLIFAELRHRVDGLASGLVSLGLAPGDCVAIWSPNSVEWLLAQLATASVGLVLVNLNPAYRRAEAEFALRKTGTRALVAATCDKTSDYIEMIEDMDLRPLGGAGSACPDLEYVMQIDGEGRSGWIDFHELKRRGRAAAGAVLGSGRCGGGGSRLPSSPIC